ncbi:hypothetical protein GALMADRAFT_253823 [Galerina marginata CBS 339.88]|uniref:DUF6534 domain-containing protein n=1 Tax=Galerina marginata (strain CBS 339.88) TaxID=685588 RepID=A0A067SXP1_GALM3|nr:hypothetical protein GALMADRAFT_253823 [Galerina marginata CBS 339.88]
MNELDSTLGAAFLGSLAASILYGVTSVQTFLYFQNTSGDGGIFQSSIFSLWLSYAPLVKNVAEQTLLFRVLDTIHMAFTAHGIYFYLVTNFGRFQVLLRPTWSLLAGVYLTNISDIMVRCFFAKRVSSLCGHRRPILRVVIPVLIILLAIAVFATGCAFASEAFILETFERLNEVSYLLYISFAIGVVADLLVAITLCVLLFNNRTGIKRTDSILTILMAFSINTGLLTSFCAMACLITYAIWPQGFIFMALYFALSKLYVNSLLASLNARNSLRKRDQAEPTNLDPVSTPIVFPMQSANLTTKEEDALQNTESTRSL